MTLLHWLLLVPFLAAGLCFLSARANQCMRLCGATLGLLFVLGVSAMLWLPTDSVASDSIFAIDVVAAPLLPVFALLHLLTLLGTAKRVVSRLYCVRSMLATGLSMLAVTCQNDTLLLVLLMLGVGLPLWEMHERKRSARVFSIYMLLFVALLIAALLTGVTDKTPMGIGLLLLAVLVRGGIFPAHSWLPSLFAGATYATTMVFMLPLLEVLVVIRLLPAETPEWMLEAAGMLCLATTIYGGGLAMVQKEISRFFAFLCVSQTSLIMYAVLLHTANGVTAALCMGISSALSLTGLAFAIRSLESRFGQLSLDEYHGHYRQVPGLAVIFLITGLGCIGFPGTIGFVPMDLLYGGSYEKGLAITATLVIAIMLNGIAILRAYFSLFTGRVQTTSIALSVTPPERLGIVLITLVMFAGVWLSPEMVKSRHATAEKLLQASSSPQSEH